MHHTKPISYWHKETASDYSIAESLYRMLNEKALYRKYPHFWPVTTQTTTILVIPW